MIENGVPVSFENLLSRADDVVLQELIGSDVVRLLRGCRQKSLLQIITARSWQMARYDAALLA